MTLPDILHHHRKPFPVDAASNFLANVRRDDIERASHTLSNEVVRTPLLPYMGPSSGNSIFLKPENLQPRGSFKTRCSRNSVMNLSPAELSKGIYTASTGNFALGVAHTARARAVDVRVYVTETAAKSKVDALRELGAEVIDVAILRVVKH